MRSSIAPQASTLVAKLVEATGSIHVYRYARRVIVNRVEGHLSEAMARCWITGVEPSFVIGALEALADWQNMTGYDAEARRALTKWALDRRQDTLYAHFLVPPGMVAMGVSVAAMTLSLAGIDVHSTTDRAAFEAAVRKRIEVAEREQRGVARPL
jgi:hypothetical protein